MDIDRGQLRGGQAGVTCPKCGYKLADWEPFYDQSGLLAAGSVFTCQQCETTWIDVPSEEE